MSLKEHEFPVPISDGTTLVVTRLARENIPAKPPVVLLHGLGANRLSYHMDDEHSFADFISEEYDVWLLDLRGHGKTGRERWNWSVDDYIHHDVPAALDFIAEKSGVASMAAIGHSMGGIIFLSYLADCAVRASGAGVRTPSRIHSLITIGSSLCYRGTGSQHEKLLKFRPVGRFLPLLPLGWLKKQLSRLAGKIENPLEAFYYNRENMNPEICRKLFADGFHAIPSKVLVQLATLFDEGGFKSWDGQITYAEGLRNTEARILAAFGDLDFQCPPMTAEFLRKFVPPTQFYESVFPTYGHFDLLLGEKTKTDVFPELLSWLKSERRDSDRA